MAPLVGTYEHTLDGKGRLVLPSKFRNHFGESLYVSPGAGCLSLYTAEAFQETLERLTAQARAGDVSQMAWRGFAARSEEVRQDAQGRILLPAHLRADAGLDREVVVTGAIERVEVWSGPAWQALETQMRQAVVDELSGPFGV
jgi:MraZ protein